MICPLLLLSLMLSVAFAGDWPQWRGPLLQRNPPTYGHAMDQKPERKSWLICLDPATGRVM